MSNYLVDGSDLTDIADAIRTKGGTSGQLQFPQGFVDAVEAIETGGEDEYGLKDVTYTNTDATWSITVANNRFSNCTLPNGASRFFKLKKPIVCVGGDIISISVRKRSGSLGWSRIGFYASPTGELRLNDNFNFTKSKQTFDLTIGDYGYSREIDYLWINNRNGAWSNGSFDVEVALNGTVLFSSF